MYSILESNPLITVFFVLGLGIYIGRLKIGGMEIGGVTGVLFVGLLAGHFRLPSPEVTDNLGFILFIYGIGFEAGPRFMEAFKRDGMRYLALSLLVFLVTGSLALGLSRFFELDFGMASGILGGALTSTPTIVAAQDAAAQGVVMPPGVTQEMVQSNISAAYAITYIFGLVGLILMIRFLPKLARVDLASEAKAIGESDLQGPDAEQYLNQMPETMIPHAYRVENADVIGGRLGDRSYSLPGDIQRIKRGGEVIRPEPETVLEEGDIIVVVGPARIHRTMLEQVGSEVVDHELFDRSLETRRVVVASKSLRGQTLADANFSGKYDVWLTELSRAGHTLPRRPEIALQVGDVLTLSGVRSKLDAVSDVLGFTMQRRWQTDLFAFAIGIGVGLVFGLLKVQVGGVEIGLGSAGGALLAGILFGTLNSVRPDRARFPAGARFILMELGLLMFMAGVAEDAGRTIVATFLEYGPLLVLCGAIVTIAPVLVAWLFGRHVLRMNGALLIGAITGAMTSTAALKQVQAEAKSSIPALGYVGSYTFANVLLAVAGALLMRF